MFNLIFYLLCFFVSASDDLFDKAELQIKKILGEKVSVTQSLFIIKEETKRKIENESSQKFFRNQIHYWKIYNNQKLTNIAFLDNVYGKALPITFLVILDLDGKVIHTSIIKYREQYGGGVANENWLIQFLGFDSNSNFTIGKEVQGLSGATISANSISRGIKKITLLFRLEKDEFTN